ncbi:MAG: two-component regulator propeller domain-containing protein [Ignavibacteriaceae bacterium]
MNGYLKNIFILSFVISFTLQSQTITPKFDKFTVKIPTCILQDSSGFIWIGSQEGLLRYDGFTFKKYQTIPFDSTSLSANWVRAIAEDKYGNLWVGSFGGGLDYFNRITERFTNYNLYSKNDGAILSTAVNKIIANENGSLWIGSADKGLFYGEMDSTEKLIFTHFDLTQSINLKGENENIWIMDLFKDDSNCLWIGTKVNGLLKLDLETNRTKHFTHDPDDPLSISHNTVNSITADRSGNIWIGTGAETISDGGGLNMYNRQDRQFINFRHNPDDPHSLVSDRVYPILIDSRNTLWMNFFNEGLFSIAVFEFLNNTKPDFRNAIRYRAYATEAIYEDHFGNIWFAQFGRNLYKYDRQQNPFYWYHREQEAENTMSNSGIETIYIDKENNIWFGHHNTGLDKYDPKTGLYTNYLPKLNDPKALGAEWITGIRETNNGLFWISTMGKGLYQFDSKKEIFHHYYSIPGDSNGLNTNLITLMLLRKNGTLLLSSMDRGLLLFNPMNNRTKHIDFNSNNIEDEKIFSLFEEQDGTIWIGTIDEGIYSFQILKDKIQNVIHYAYNPSNKNSPSYNMICDIIRPVVIDTNALWIATGIGLNRFDLETKSFTHFYKNDGLPDNFTLKVLEDNQGNIWVACAIGIGMYDVKTRSWKSYGIGDGMPFETFGGCRQNTAKSKDGQLFFSGSSGSIGFFPEQIKDNPFIPPIFITDFKIFNESVKLDTSILLKKVITLSHNQNAFSFEFTALNYTNPEKNQYEYKMQGFDDDWIYAGNEHNASFTNLDPGEYIFRVRGSNNHGLWNKEGTFISIIITPPWWATWWFRTIVILTLIALGYSIYHYRINKILEMERLRIQIASDLHDDIGSALTRIAVHSEIIQTTTEKEKVSSASKRIGNMSREIITTLSDVVWSIDSRNDTVGDLIDRMRDFLETVFPAGSIHIDFQTKGLHFDQKIEQTLRQNIYLIFKESVNNAAKHSGADEIKISIINGDGKFKLKILDNGKGMDESEMHQGHHGIENMKLRAKRIGGQLIIENLNKGTSVSLIAKNI